jgi:hypothetical protein
MQPILIKKINNLSNFINSSTTWSTNAKSQYKNKNKNQETIKSHKNRRLKEFSINKTIWKLNKCKFMKRGQTCKDSFKRKIRWCLPEPKRAFSK